MIIPVYIPNQEGYFKDAFSIFKLCLESLFKTCHAKTFITLVNNGSCNEVKDFLDYLLFKSQLIAPLLPYKIGWLLLLISYFKTVSGSMVIFFHSYFFH